MTVTVEQLANYCGADAVRDEDDLTRALAVADALVENVFLTPWRPVPEVVFDECVLRTGYSIFKQGGTSEGGLFNNADGTGVPGVANDPLRKSWDLIKRYTNRV